MPTRLMNLKIKSISTVDKGDNPLAEIVLFKRRPDADTLPVAGAAVTTEGGTNMADQTRELPEEVQTQLTELAEAKATAEQAALDAATEVETLKARIAELEKEPEPDPLEKADPEIRKRLEAAEKQAQDSAAEVAKMKDEKATEAAMNTVAKLSSLPGVTVDDFAAVIKQIRLHNKDVATKIEKVLADANAALAESKLLTELGSDTPGVTDVEQRVKKLADERRVAKNITREQAEAEVWDEHPDWYAEYQSEREGRG